MLFTTVFVNQQGSQSTKPHSRVTSGTGVILMKNVLSICVAAPSTHSPRSRAIHSTSRNKSWVLKYQGFKEAGQYHTRAMIFSRMLSNLERMRCHKEHPHISKNATPWTQEMLLCLEEALEYCPELGKLQKPGKNMQTKLSMCSALPLGPPGSRLGKPCACPMRMS